MTHARDLSRLGRAGAPVLDTVADLEKIAIFSGTPENAVQTAGAFAFDDGGGALWVWDATATKEDAVHIKPLEHTGDGRYVLQSRDVDIRAARVTTDPTDATQNTLNLRALCQFFSSKGGGRIQVPNAGGRHFAINDLVLPWDLDYLTFEGPGGLRHVNLDYAYSQGDYFPAAMLMLGSYGSQEANAFAYKEVAYDIGDAPAGADSVVLDSSGDLNQFTEDGLVLIHDGTMYLKSGTIPRYLSPHVARVTDLSGATITFDPPLLAPVGNTPKIRALNTGDCVPTNAEMLTRGITHGYLTRYCNIHCDLSVAYWNEEDDQTLTHPAVDIGVFNTCLGFYCSLKGRMESANGISANLNCWTKIDVELFTDAKCWDPGYASMGADVKILLRRKAARNPIDVAALTYANEGSHRCKASIRTDGPLPGLTGTHIVAAPFAQFFDFDFDVQLPDWVGETSEAESAGSLYEGPVELNEANNFEELCATNISITGRVVVKSLEQVAVHAQVRDNTLAPLSGVYRGTRFKDLELRILNGTVTNVPDAFRAVDADGIFFDNFRMDAAADFNYTRPGDWQIDGCFLPQSNIAAIQPLTGTNPNTGKDYFRWVNRSVLAERVIDFDLRDDGQLNHTPGGILRGEGGLQGDGPIHTVRTGVDIDPGETVTIRTATQMGALARWEFIAAALDGSIMGSCLVVVSGVEVVYVQSISAMGMTWGDDGGAGVTITNDTGSTVTVNWTGTAR